MQPSQFGRKNWCHFRLSPNSLYGYVENEPLNRIDANGHCTDPFSCGLEFAGIGTLIEPGGGTAVGAAVGGLVGAGILYFSGKAVIEHIHQSENKGNDSAPAPNGSDSTAKPVVQPGSSGGTTAGQKFSPSERAQDAGKDCAYCGRPTTEEPGHENSRETDHADPRSKGGNTTPANRNPACRTCNRQKGPKNVKEFKDWQKAHPDKVPQPAPPPPPQPKQAIQSSDPRPEYGWESQ